MAGVPVMTHGVAMIMVDNFPLSLMGQMHHHVQFLLRHNSLGVPIVFNSMVSDPDDAAHCCAHPEVASDQGLQANLCEGKKIIAHTGYFALQH